MNAPVFKTKYPPVPPVSPSYFSPNPPSSPFSACLYFSLPAVKPHHRLSRPAQDQLCLRQDVGGGGGRRTRTKGAFIAVGSGWLPTDNGHILGPPKTNSCVQPALLRWAAGGKKWESSIPFWSGLGQRRGKSASRSQRWRFFLSFFFWSHVETKANKGKDGPGGEINRPTWRFRCWLVFILPLTADLRVARGGKKKRRGGCSLERAFVSREESDIGQT